MNRLSLAALACTTLAIPSFACSSGSDGSTPSVDAGATVDASPATDASSTPSADPDAATHVDGSTSPVADGSAPASDGGSSGYDIKVPATIRMQAPGQASITDATYFDGFAGSHVFGRGGKAPSAADAPSLITDCKLTVGPSGLVLVGGGETINAPLISTNANAKTLVVAYPDTLKLGGVALLTFYAADGSAVSVGITYGLVTAVSGGKTGTAIVCNKNTATSTTFDRSAETLKLATTALAPFLQKAGTASTYTQKNIVPGDLGGAAGTVLFGRGLLDAAGASRLVDDCKVVVSGGTITVSGGGVTGIPATFTGAASDAMLFVQTPTDKQFNFQPEGGGNATLQVNAFGFVTQATGKAADGTTFTCPK
jgi:hypothetical protein